ncbi:MAG TPA: L,D-transpeptidase family protein [Sphingomicrobium sp.]|nr:L,D-transpeptidase family protein [Sphingomicrobium sp.]
MKLRITVSIGLMTAPLGVVWAQQVDPMAPLPPASATLQTVPPVEVAPVLPPAIWQIPDAEQLVAFIRTVGREGLSAVDYDPSGLEQALRTGDPMRVSAAATDRFNRLSYDLALGHVRRAERTGWHIADRDLDATRQRQLLDQALASHRIAESLTGLLPTHPQYGALRYALEVTPKTETNKLNRIRLNMDRWRWLPRDLGAKYIIVNVPAYHATLVENGATRWRHRAIAGALKTPTPQLTATASGVILNPWWEVPASITREVAGKSGYVAVKGTDGKVQRWRQPPGSNNALGQLKFVMPNQYAIFLHDTNARSRFNSSIRALSHGCIRTEHIVDLATELLSDDAGEWTADRVKAALASKKTVQANFVKPLPVYIVYFSSAALVDGTIVNYDDVYKRDGKVIAALLDSDGGTAPAQKVAAR